jgi:hypothetical protein
MRNELYNECKKLYQACYLLVVPTPVLKQILGRRHQWLRTAWHLAFALPPAVYSCWSTASALLRAVKVQVLKNAYAISKISAPIFAANSKFELKLCSAAAMHKCVFYMCRRHQCCSHTNEMVCRAFVVVVPRFLCLTSPFAHTTLLHLQRYCTAQKKQSEKPTTLLAPTALQQQLLLQHSDTTTVLVLQLQQPRTARSNALSSSSSTEHTCFCSSYMLRYRVAS